MENNEGRLYCASVVGINEYCTTDDLERQINLEVWQSGLLRQS